MEWIVLSRESEVDRAQLLRELMEAHGNDVVRTVYLYVRDRHAAEDIAQDVFVKVYDHLDTFRRDSSYRTWILRIAANAAKDYLRGAARRTIPVEDVAATSTAPSVEQTLIGRARDRALWQAVMALPDRYRESVWLYYAQDLTVEEIAQVTKSTVSSVKTRLHRGRELLRRTWEGGEADESAGR
jgi:RNA polymerase sigma-70 factor (ECF subfamily)